MGLLSNRGSVAADPRRLSIFTDFAVQVWCRDSSHSGCFEFPTVAFVFVAWCIKWLKPWFQTPTYLVISNAPENHHCEEWDWRPVPNLELSWKNRGPLEGILLIENGMFHEINTIQLMGVSPSVSCFARLACCASLELGRAGVGVAWTTHRGQDEVFE